MRISRQSRMLLVAVFALSLLGANCEDLKPPPDTIPTCAVGSAQIAVWEGFLQVVCGCGGTDGAIVTPNTPLACSFKLGNTLFINFYGKLRHQIVPVGSPALPASSVYDPSNNGDPVVYGYAPSATGTYSFMDQFNSTLTGVITVTP